MEPSSNSREASRPRSRRGNISHQDHPFLELQQAGFNMLERELGGMRRSVRRMHTSLSRIELLLRPLGSIAGSLERLAGAVEGLLPAASPPPSTQSPPPTRTTRSTLALAASGSSRGRPRRGAPRLRTRGGRRPAV